VCRRGRPVRDRSPRRPRPRFGSSLSFRMTEEGRRAARGGFFTCERSETKNAHVHVPKVLSRSPTESTRNTRKSTALETARNGDRAFALEISVRGAGPATFERTPARASHLRARRVDDVVTDHVRPRRKQPSRTAHATIVTCLASPPKRHRTIRHALRWHETAQGTTRPPKAVRLARAFARRSAFSRVARARDGRSVDRASRAEAPFHATVPTPREAIGGQLGGPPHSIPTASRGRASARAEGHPGCSGSVLSRVRAALSLHAARALRLGALGVPGGPPPAHRSSVRAPRNRPPAPATCRRRRFPRLSAETLFFLERLSRFLKTFSDVAPTSSPSSSPSSARVLFVSFSFSCPSGRLH